VPLDALLGVLTGTLAFGSLLASLAPSPGSVGPGRPAASTAPRMATPEAAHQSAGENSAA